ncbi:hypothetical protein J7K25_01070 [bacterium]|nr:hypothetical protein [bacterium]
MNRREPRLYVLLESKDKFGNLSQKWLKYYKSKRWVEFKEISARESIKKYKNKIKGFVVYDPDFKHSIKKIYVEKINYFRLKIHQLVDF